MKNIALSILFLMFCQLGYSQGSDMVVLKRGHQTLKTYFPGLNIHFISMSGEDVVGTVRRIEHDSLYLNIYDQRRAYTIWGTSFWDTISVGLSRFHINEIREIVKPSRGFGFIRNGFLFTLSGISYAILHLVNSAYFRVKPENKTLAFCGAAIATGIVLKRTHRSTVELGKKYRLNYIPLK